jgi:hypothetical protein
VIDYSIGLLLKNPSDNDGCKTTLICAPRALLHQWYKEIRTKTNLVVSLDDYKKLHQLRERVRLRSRKRNGWEDEEHETLRKRVKVELNVKEEVGSEGDEVGKQLVKWVNPERYDKYAMAHLDEEWISTAKLTRC